MLSDSGLATVPLVAEGVFSKEQLQALLETKSQYCDELLEVGVGVRATYGANEGPAICLGSLPSPRRRRPPPAPREACASWVLAKRRVRYALDEEAAGEEHRASLRTNCRLFSTRVLHVSP
jgi:hypothetical protein